MTYMNGSMNLSSDLLLDCRPTNLIWDLATEWWDGGSASRDNTSFHCESTQAEKYVCEGVTTGIPLGIGVPFVLRALIWARVRHQKKIREALNKESVGHELEERNEAEGGSSDLSPKYSSVTDVGSEHSEATATEDRPEVRSTPTEQLGVRA